MSVLEIWVCDMCGAENRDYGPDDGLPPGWQKNLDAEDFCSDCLEKQPLDPPDGDEWGPDNATEALERGPR